MSTMLPFTQRERLLAVADIIENEPNKFNMESFFGFRPISDDADPEKVKSELNDENNIGIGSDCGTTACIAGWAIRLSPPEEVAEWRYGSIEGLKSTTKIGAQQLGISEDLAFVLFYLLDLHEEPWVAAKILRMLADLPESERTLAKAEELGIPELLSESDRWRWKVEKRALEIALADDEERE